jgi:hypothetical protein
MMMTEQLRQDILDAVAEHFNDWLSDRLSEYIEELAAILSPDLMPEAIEIMAQVINDAVKGLEGYSRQLADKVA